MDRKTVHILLKQAVAADPRSLETALRHLEHTAGISQFDVGRARAFGIVSASVDATRIASIADMKEVESVQADGKLYAY